MSMTLEQLRVFVAVAERQHVTRAAAALNLAQSAVSAAIRALEEGHDTQLFHRVGRGIVLTEAGRLFLAEARAVLARADAAERALAELSGLARGTLALQASQTIAGYWLPRHLAEFRRRHPAVAIDLAIGNTTQVAAAIHEGAAELGFVEGLVDDPALVLTQVARDRLIVVAAPDHPWAGRASLTPDELVTGDWVLREQGSGTRGVFEAKLAGFGIPTGSLRVVLELPSNEAVRAAVEAGMGATALSASVAAASLEAGLLAQAPFALPDRWYHAVHHAERYLGHAANALLTQIGGAPAEG